MLENHKLASSIAIEIKEMFISHLINAADNSVERVGFVSEQTLKKIEQGKKIDARPIKMMAVSGKGDKHHPESINVTLFDHSVNVACGAVRLAAHDLINDGMSSEDIRVSLAQMAAVGFTHDIDKLYGVPWCDVNLEMCADFIQQWKLDEWFASFGKSITPELLKALIDGVESRTAISTPPNDVSPGLFSLVRRYIRAADMLESVYLKSMNNTENVVKAWRQVHQNSLISPAAFDDIMVYKFTDKHNTFLLDTFQNMVIAACVDVSGMPPLFSSILGGTLTAFLPKSYADEIISEAVADLVRKLPLNTSVVISPQGVIKLSGAVPLCETITSIVKDAVIEKGSKFFPVKNVDLIKQVDGSEQTVWQAIKKMANDAYLPANSEMGPKSLTYVVPTPGDSTMELEEIVDAAEIVFLTNVKEVTKSKEMKATNRLDNLADLLGVEIPTWFSNLEALTRRTCICLLCAKALQEATDDIKNKYDQYVSLLLSEKGIFELYSDKSGAVSRSVKEHFSSKSSVVSDSKAEEAFRCIITGVPISDRWKISAVDGLHNIKSSAISYRDGRSEEKFKEVADAHISPLSFAEFKLRQNSEASSLAKSVPVKVTSMWNCGFFGSQYFVGDELLPSREAELSTFDVLREDTSKITIKPLESYRSLIRFGRFEDLGDKFSDRCDFFIRIIRTIQRTGRPLHVFQGLPLPVADFFYSDCLGRDLESLIGGSGLRVEELDYAKKSLDMVAFLSKSPGDGGLGQVELARSLCYPKSRLKSALLAWWICNNKSVNENFARILAKEIIPKEIKKMEEQKMNMPEIKLGRIARKFQKRPMSSDSNSTIEFVMRTAFEQAEMLYSSGRRGIENADVYIATISETLMQEAQRKAGRGGFFSSAVNRAPDENLSMVATELASTFVNEIWQEICKGRPCKHSQKRQMLAAYSFSFKNMNFND